MTMLASIVVWTSTALLLLWRVFSPHEGLTTVVAPFVFGGVVVSLILTARQRRGWTSAADAFFPLAWLAPDHATFLWSGQLLLIGATSLACSAFLYLVPLCDRCDRQEVGTEQRPVSWRSPVFYAMLAVGAFLWLSLMRFPVPRGIRLGDSWTQSLGYFYTHGSHAGVDFIFTYGPLGYFSTSAYNADLFWQKVAWELGMKLFIVVLLIRSKWSRQGTYPTFLYWFTLIVVLPGSPDALLLFTMSALTLWLISTCDQRSTGSFSLAMFFFAIFSMVKFSFFVLTIICLLGIVSILWNKCSRHIAIGVVGLFVSEFLIIWSFCGQSLLNIWPYIATSLQITTGFSEAMVQHNAYELSWAISILGVFIASLIVTSLHDPRTLESLLIKGVVTAALFLAWKHGVVRADFGHTSQLFAFFALAPFLLWAPLIRTRPSSSLSHLLFLGCNIISLLAFFGTVAESRNVSPSPVPAIRNTLTRTVKSFQTLGSISQVKEAHDKRIQAFQKGYALPLIRSLVKNRSVDIISHEQGVVLLNNLHWKPRPVFQSYVTFTPELLQRNAEFFISSHAPDFLLFKLQTIDRRFPTLDDGQALRLILRHYTPVLAEKSYLLLQRNTDSIPPLPSPTSPVFDQQIDFAEDVDLHALNAKPLVASFDIRYSLLGQLRKLLYKAPRIFLHVTLDTGRTLQYRLVPGMARSGFLLTPLLRSREDIISWYTGAKLSHISSFRIQLEDPQHARYFAPVIRVTLQEEARSERVVENINQLLYPLFDPVPSEVSSSFRQFKVHNADALLVPAPGWLRFHLSPGIYRLNGGFGLRPEAYTKGTDGVVFQVKTDTAQEGEKILFKRSLNPNQVAQDRGIQSLNLAFHVHTKTDLILETHPGPAGDTFRDWSYWTQVQIKKQSEP